MAEQHHSCGGVCVTETDESLTNTISVLYELSLAIGTSLELNSNCEAFFDCIMSRRDLTQCVLLLDESVFESDDRSTDQGHIFFRCAFASPSLAIDSAKVLCSDPRHEKLMSEGALSCPVSELGDFFLGDALQLGDRGLASLFRLPNLGFVLCVQKHRDECYSQAELSKNITVFRKFGNSISACLGHQRLANETAKRIELQSRLARSERMESLGLMAGGVAHDLNNIICPIVSYTELVLDELTESQSTHALVKEIEVAAWKASDVIGDLLTLARRGRKIETIIDLPTAVREYLTSMTFKTTREHAPNVLWQTSVTTEATILANQTALERVVMNLVANAFDELNGVGEICLDVFDAQFEQAKCGYEEVPPGNYAIIRVRDNGGGIRPEHIHRIFEPFFSGKIMARSGSGLGLSIVYGIVKDVGGYVDVKSSSAGTMFEMYFPIVDNSPNKRRPHRQRRSSLKLSR